MNQSPEVISESHVMLSIGINLHLIKKLQKLVQINLHGYIQYSMTPALIEAHEVTPDHHVPERLQSLKNRSIR